MEKTANEIQKERRKEIEDKAKNLRHGRLERIRRNLQN